MKLTPPLLGQGPRPLRDRRRPAAVRRVRPHQRLRRGHGRAHPGQGPGAHRPDRRSGPSCSTTSRRPTSCRVVDDAARRDGLVRATPTTSSAGRCSSAGRDAPARVHRARLRVGVGVEGVPHGGHHPRRCRCPPARRRATRLPEPIFTPSTKATEGHDENISLRRRRRSRRRRRRRPRRGTSASPPTSGAPSGPRSGASSSPTPSSSSAGSTGELAICDEILDPRLVPVLAGRRLEARLDAAVARQAAGAGLAGEHRLGQDAAAPGAARRGRRRHPAPLRRGLRAAHRTVRSPTGRACGDSA